MRSLPLRRQDPRDRATISLSYAPPDWARSRRVNFARPSRVHGVPYAYAAPGFEFCPSDARILEPVPQYSFPTLPQSGHALGVVILRVPRECSLIAMDAQLQIRTLPLRRQDPRDCVTISFFLAPPVWARSRRNMIPRSSRILGDRYGCSAQ